MRNSESILEKANQNSGREREWRKRERKFSRIMESLRSRNSELRKEPFANINRTCNPNQNVIQLFDEYTTMVTEARYKAIKETKAVKANNGKVIKILTTNEMLQLQTGNASDSKNR